jgi:thiamine-phosphate pyrophosphorylase
MSDAEASRCRLCLVTPRDIDGATFAPILQEALAGGDVASLIITAAPTALQDIAEALVPVAQARGVAALVHNDTRIVGRAKADGVHVDSSLADLAAAIAALRPKRIVGAGNLWSRHDAMLAGEADPDYVFFGRLDGDTGDRIFGKALDLAAWWSAIMKIPAIVMGGSSLQSVREAAEAGIEFVTLRRAVWEHASGPRQAVDEANRLLAAAREDAS